jgi:cell division protein FtsN
MTRDYKPHSRSKKTPSSGSGSSLLVGILIGLLLGLAIALAVALYLNKVPGPFVSRGKSVEAPAKSERSEDKAPASQTTRAADADATSDEKPRFDFYNILPGADDPNKGKPAAAPATPPDEKTPEQQPPATAAKEIFFLQAGAFQNAADADNMKARLAMLGIEASVQIANSGDRGTFHRVRIGPFSKVDEVNRTRDTLKQNGIESTLIKGREKAN